MPREEHLFKTEVGADEEDAVAVEAVVAKVGGQEIERAGPKYPGGGATEEEEGVEGVTSNGKGRRAAQNLPGEGVPSVRMRQLAIPPPQPGTFALAYQSSKTRTARHLHISGGGSSPSHYH